MTTVQERWIYSSICYPEEWMEEKEGNNKKEEEVYKELRLLSSLINRV
jgi:hypothetical protein